MNLNHLRVFHAIALNGSITAAAESLSISQPAVSKQLGLLERALKVRLVERRSRGIGLTPHGMTLSEIATRLFSLESEAERAMADLSHLRTGLVRLAATPTLASYLLPSAIVHCRRRFPGVEVQIETEIANRIAHRVDGAEIDFGVTDTLMHAMRSNTRVFGQQELAVIAPRQHPLARRSRIAPVDLADSDWVVRELGSSTRSFAEQLMSRHGIAIRPTLSLGSSEAIKRAVAGGLGVAILPVIAIQLEVAAKQIAILKVAPLELKRPIYVYTPQHQPESKAGTAFLCILKHAIRGTLPVLRKPV